MFGQLGDPGEAEWHRGNMQPIFNNLHQMWHAMTRINLWGRAALLRRCVYNRCIFLVADMRKLFQRNAISEPWQAYFFHVPQINFACMEHKRDRAPQKWSPGKVCHSQITWFIMMQLSRSVVDFVTESKLKKPRNNLAWTYCDVHGQRHKKKREMARLENTSTSSKNGTDQTGFVWVKKLIPYCFVCMHTP